MKIASRPIPVDARRFRAQLLRWYRRHRRPLPWRRTRDSYRVWISEIMLQQTRVAAVLPRYRDFLRRFPTLRALAVAPLNQVLAAWSGLGYYRRARSLHRAAQLVVGQHRARLPRSFEELRGLPGIGRYTASAIASIAFGEPCAVLDGNVARVLRRVLDRSDAGAAELLLAANELLSRRRPGDFNQALMELGATVCLPVRPCCDLCPVRRWCRTQGTHVSAPPPSRRKKKVICLLSQLAERVYLVRRGESESLMPGMWELPTVPGSAIRQRPRGCSSSRKPEFVVRHSITTTDYRVSVLRVPAENISARGGRWVRCAAVGKLPLTGLARKVLRQARVI